MATAPARRIPEGQCHRARRSSKPKREPDVLPHGVQDTRPLGPCASFNPCETSFRLFCPPQLAGLNSCVPYHNRPHEEPTVWSWPGRPLILRPQIDPTLQGNEGRRKPPGRMWAHQYRAAAIAPVREPDFHIGIHRPIRNFGLLRCGPVRKRKPFRRAGVALTASGIDSCLVPTSDIATVPRIPWPGSHCWTHSSAEKILQR